VNKGCKWSDNNTIIVTTKHGRELWRRHPVKHISKFTKYLEVSLEKGQSYQWDEGTLALNFKEQEGWVGKNFWSVLDTITPFTDIDGLDFIVPYCKNKTS